MSLTSSRSCRRTASDVTQKESQVPVLTFPAEDSLEVVLEGKVEGLRREVTDHIRTVSPPERTQTLFSLNLREAHVFAKVTHVDFG
jgi:hypothetical protein